MDKQVFEEFTDDANSVGALHGSARGERNIGGRLRAMRRLAPLSGQRLLDVGCGTGEYTNRMAPDFETVDAIDIEPERLELFATRHPLNVTVKSMSANDLDYPNETFDVVTMVEVLEHLSEPRVALSEIQRVLKVGGKLLLTTPNRAWPLEQHGVLLGKRRYPGPIAPGLVWIKPLHRRFSDANAFTKTDLDRLAGQSGLELDEVTYMMPPLDSLTAGSRVHQILDRAELSPLRRLGQTIVGCMTREPQ
ncbi:MAG: SAM-dependent methyltransferase [Verrucomicrobiales bacterium]|jgi:SAM-dependent methyltransferase